MDNEPQHDERGALELGELDLEVSEESSALIAYMPGPVFLLEFKRKVVWRNRASLEKHFLDAVGLPPDRLKFKDAAIDLAVGTFIESVFAGGGSEGHRFSLNRGGTDWDMLAFRKGFVRMRRDQSFTRRDRVLLVWQALPASREVEARPLEFRLSPVERRLVDCIISGCTVKQASIELNISYHTARKYLQAVFVKTGTRRQAELVARVHQQAAAGR